MYFIVPIVKQVRYVLLLKLLDQFWWTDLILFILSAE